MKKRFLSILLTVAMVLSLLAIPVSAETAISGTCGDNLTWTLNDGVLTISGTGDMTNYTNSGLVPWASDHEKITSVVIEAGVTSISFAAFLRCSSLTSITIPDGVTSIEDETFEGCSSLTSITIPDSVTSIGYSAFSGCTSLTSVTIPNSVARIDQEAFYKCSSLTSITISNSIIGIEAATFAGCSSLTSINIPSSVTYITAWAFQNCTSLTNINIPSSVDYISDSAFKGCTSLTSINIPSSVTQIDDAAFKGCTSLTSINIPSSVYYISESTFEGCSSLTSITISDSVNTIENFAFYNCTNLADVYYRGSEEDWSKITIEEYNECLTNATIHFNSADPEPTITRFDDVQDSSSWYYIPVYWAVDEGITSGTGDGKFSPSMQCSRAQIVTFLWNAAGQPEPTTTTSKFTDVDSSAWYYKAVLWAVENGVTSGTTETTFSPSMQCSRAQIVTFLWNCEGKNLATQNSAFTDVPASAWYYAAVQWAVENGVTSGTGDNKFSPDAICNRAQAVTFLHNYMGD